MAALERISGELHERRRQSATPSPSARRLDTVLRERRSSAIADTDSTASLDPVLLESFCSSKASAVSGDDGIGGPEAAHMRMQPSECEAYRPAAANGTDSSRT